MALYKETHKIKVFEPNSITLNAVQGEGNEREYEFILIEKSGDTLKTTNAPITDKMLDVTGCSVRLYVAKADGHIVYMEGKVADAKGGVISFVPKQQVFTASGKANCILQITSANGDLRAVGVTMNIGKADIDVALESKDELTALSQALIEFQKAIAGGTDGTEVPLARGGETLLGKRLDKIESGERIATGAITVDKISADVKSAFAAKGHNHNGAYIPNTNGAVTPALLSAAAKALFAQIEYAGAAKFLPDDITIRAGSIKGAVNSAAIQSGAVTTGKLADGAVTEQKIAEAFVNKYGHLPFTDVTDYGNSADIPYDDYTNNGIYRFTGRYTPVLLFVFIGSVSYTTQIRIQGEQIQSRFFNIREWTEWSGGKAEIAESLTQLDAQIAQLQIDTQAHGAKLDTLDRIYAGTATIATTNSYKMDAAQVVPNSKVYLTLTNGPSTSCFVRSDFYPLYYYGTDQVVQPEYNTPIPVSAEDLIAGIKLNYGGAFTIKYQTAPSKVFFDYADNAAESAKKKYVPYAKNQITGHAEGITAEITDGAPGTFIKSAVVRGKSAVDETTGAITPLSPAVIVASSNDGTVENHVNLPTGLQLYGTPNNQYYDTYNAITGKLTRNCGKVLLASVGWIYGYSTSAAAVTWITANNYVPSKTYYLVHNGTVSTQTTDWQGKISLTINKADAGITAEDTAAAAAQKMKAYWGEAYAVLPLKTPTTEQFEPVQLAIPTKVCAVVCNNGYLDVTYCRDIDTAYLDLLEYTTGLEARIAQLEISTGGGETI